MHGQVFVFYKVFAMASLIRETPVLEGKDAIRFIELMCTAQPETPERVAEIKEAYEAVMEMMERGEREHREYKERLSLNKTSRD